MFGMYVILHVFTMLFWGFPARPAKKFRIRYGYICLCGLMYTCPYMERHPVNKSVQLMSPAL